MIVAALSIAGFLLYPRWKGWPSAALFAVAVAVKVSPVLLVLVMVLYFRDWRFLLKTLACGLAVFAVSLVWVDVSLYREYVTDILPAIAGSDPSPYNQTPLRFWSRYPTLVKAGSALGYAALLFLAWLAGRNARRLPQAERRVEAGTERNAMLLLAVLLMLLFSPLAWQMAYVWVIVPLALRPRGAAARRPPGGAIALGVAATLLSLRMWPYRVLDMTNIDRRRRGRADRHPLLPAAGGRACFAGSVPPDRRGPVSTAACRMTAPPTPACPKDGPGDDGATRSVAGLTRRSLCILLLLFAAVFAANMWAELTGTRSTGTTRARCPTWTSRSTTRAGPTGPRARSLPQPPRRAGGDRAPAHEPAQISRVTSTRRRLLPVFGALARLRYDTAARTVWLALDLAAFAALVAVAALVSTAAGASRALTAAVLLTVVSFPFYWHITYGQIDMIVAALSISAFLLYPRWRGGRPPPCSPRRSHQGGPRRHPGGWWWPTTATGGSCSRRSRAARSPSRSRCSRSTGRCSSSTSYRDPSGHLRCPTPPPYNQTPLRFWCELPAVTKLAPLLGYARSSCCSPGWRTAPEAPRRRGAPRRPRTERHAVLLFAVLMMLFFSPLAWQQAYVWPIVPLALVFVVAAAARAAGAVVAPRGRRDPAVARRWS